MIEAVEGVWRVSGLACVIPCARRQSGQAAAPGYRLGATLILLLACACTTAAPARSNALPVSEVRTAVGEHFLAAHGVRAFAGGYVDPGLEFWTSPLQIVSGYRIELLPAVTAGEALPLQPVSASVDAFGFTRHYRGDGYRIEERVETRAQLPGVRVHYRLQAPARTRLRVRMQPSLNLMWPAAIGGQEIRWKSELSGFSITEPRKRFNAVVLSPQVIAHSEPGNAMRSNPFDAPVWLQLQPTRCGDWQCAEVVMAGDVDGGDDPAAVAGALLKAPLTPDAFDVTRFTAASRMRITTPDPRANRALQWAQVGLEQMWSCNPRLGCGLVAGYGPSRGARAQYAWYFAGDGLVATRALLASGNFARAAQELDFILRYQHPDTGKDAAGNAGMIWHEMSHSAPWLDWVGDYHYMYVHVDITFDLLQGIADYLRSTGDRAFVIRHWPAIQRAYRYCLSTIDAGDGLPRVPPGKMSLNEQDALSDEVTLSAAWVHAATAMGELAAAMEDAALASDARKAAERARSAVHARYWDASAQRWISGFSRSGKPAQNTAGADLAALGSGAAAADEAAIILKRLTTPAYLTNWGMRSKPSSDSDYDPLEYSRGSVWGLGTGIAAEALWRFDRPDAAVALWNGLLSWVDVDAPGHWHEVMRGDVMQPQSESVPEQSWSAAAFLSAAMRGMLGIEPDAMRHSLRFAPRLPPQWHQLQIDALRVGSNRLDLQLQLTTAGAATLTVDNDGEPIRLHWQMPASAAGGAARVLEVELPRGRRVLRL